MDGARLVKEVKTIADSVDPAELPAKLEELKKMKSIEYKKAMKVSILGANDDRVY